MKRNNIYYSEATERSGLAKMETEIFLQRVRAKSGNKSLNEKRDSTAIGVSVPETISDILLDEVARQSKLLPFVHLARFKGRARQLVGCTITEAGWMEACDTSKEITLDLREIPLDAYKVSGYFAICDAVRDGSDPELFEELVKSVGGSVARAVDKAILFGTGLKMPLGICSRLAQTAAPATWKDTMPAWADLHESHIITLNVDGETGEAFFTPICDTLAAAVPGISDKGLFWAMNRKTHRHLLAKAGAYRFDNAGVNTMPILGGSIVDFDDNLIPDNQIIGGYGENFIMGERTEMGLEQSEHYYFMQDQTVYKGSGYYDGMPAAGNAFVALRFDGTAPTTDATF